MSVLQLRTPGGEIIDLPLLKGEDGKSAYELAVDNGFEGTEKEWLESLNGKDGKSAYEIAVENGFEGTEEEWLESLKGTGTGAGGSLNITDDGAGNVIIETIGSGISITDDGNGNVVIK